MTDPAPNPRWLKRLALLGEIHAERERQDAKFGTERDHPLIPMAGEHTWGPCMQLGIPTEYQAKQNVERAFARVQGTYGHIAVEELSEFVTACAEYGETSDEARTELVQTIAVMMAMLESLDRRRAK